MEKVAVLDLLSEARTAGLRVWIENEDLVIRGPRRAEPLAVQLFDHKDEVLAWLRISEPLPVNVIEQCFNNGCPVLLEFKQGRAHCRRCDTYQRIVS
jgi:hypothetical protein